MQILASGWMFFWLLNSHFEGVIPRARVLSSGRRDLLNTRRWAGDPSLRLKNGSGRDDASNRVILKLSIAHGSLIFDQNRPQADRNGRTVDLGYVAGEVLKTNRSCGRRL